MMNIKFKIIFFIFVISLSFFFFFLGFNFSNPTNTDWLRTQDLISYQDAWNFYKNDDWRFPIGRIPNYGIEIGNSIVYADIIPIFAIFFKSLKNFLFFNFQYYSIWIFLSIFLQCYIAFLIIFKFTKSYNYSILGSIFFVISPVFISRLGMHIALASHWLILFAFYIETLNKKKDLLRNLNILLSLSIHFSLTIIITIIHYIFKVNQLFNKEKRLKFFLDSSLLLIFSFLIMYILGYFEIPPYDGLGGGYGYFAFNLNSFFNPLNTINDLNNSWSILIPALEFPRGHYEGFAYLGLSGILFFLLFLLSFFVRKNGFIFNKKKIVFISLVFLTSATTHQIYFSENLLVSFSLNNYVYGLLGIIRASGRMIWPLYYLIFIIGIIFIFKNFNKTKSMSILTVLLLIQIVDLIPGFSNFYNGKIYQYNHKLKDEIWSILPKHYENVKVLERKNNSDLYKMMPDYLGRNNFKKTDIFNAARLDRQKLKEGSYLTTKEFSEGYIDEKSFYLTIYKQQAIIMKKIFENKKNYHFYNRDGIWILTNKELLKKNEDELKKFRDLKPQFLEFNKKVKINFDLNNGYQGLGWATLSTDGIQSVGYLSSIIFSIDKKKCNNINDLNIYFNLNEKLHIKEKFEIEVFINKNFYDKIDLKKINNKYFPINIDCKENNYLIEFHTLNPVSLRETKKNLNAEKLGFGINYIQLKN